MVHETLSQKTHHIKRVGGVAQGVGPEFKLQCHLNKRKRKKEKKGNCIKK
jgi:hypothetical protein